MAWLGVIELFLWGVFWWFFAEEWYPRLENWAYSKVERGSES